MSKNLPVRLPAPFFDTAVVGMANAFLSQIHLVIDYDRTLDRDRFARACRLLLDAEPVLGCRYQDDLFTPHWLRLSPESLAEKPVFRFMEAEAAEGKETASFLGEPLDPTKGPPIKIMLLRLKDRDRIIVKVDHQVTDAGGLKYIGRRLADLYNRLEGNPDLTVDPNRTRRDQGQVYESFIPAGLPALAARFLRDMRILFYPIGNLMFPMGHAKTGQPVFIRRRFNPERVGQAQKLAASCGATINDLANAALIRALISAAGWNGRSALRIVGTVDLRRYLKQGSGESVSNLSGWYFLNLGRDPGKDLVETINKVREQTAFIKNDRIGLGFSLYVYLVLRTMPYFLRTRYMNMNINLFNRIGNMPPTLTNMGLIDDRRLGFHPAGVTDAYLLIPPTTPPVLGLGLSGCRGGLTLSTGYYESAVSGSAVENLFDHFDREFPGYGNFDSD